MIYKKTYPLFIVVATASLFLLTAFTKPPQLVATKYNTFKSVRDTLPADNDTTLKVFEKVEEEAYFPGGEQAWRSWLGQNLNPSVPVDKGAPPGLYTVYIQFVVDLNGKTSAIKALTKHGYGMEAEVMRILRKSPPWIPAVQDGKNVRAYRKQPVTFQVEVEKKKKRGKG